ncbi:F0F1 ATP synthase subunit epsilon [Rickettsia prowazekii]|uniref:ATP synthase epsilon chain n=2 Tax=Rickettsia prowazekii TaxID=782 RepID=ATPE_RICPR|nr:F0F1 ATP synthase subunit epsilon [Rickettsia prowazekii]Q9ZCF3.1 RecName: Full=ATP synthase epsilon chain; AltName: Full=ATP synthase F1 sector epsilon subunit; AltName: Full=F-ATPase epsilon subunit [Rickettsia prowazekii str. Madrid E]EOB10277.1 ATP synthase epsilon chain [Rickettsia prowazekii str. GvF12]ADE30364.1 ATP synthase epsilon chain [Rickettsia prowazekii str. Rp22]AFE49595.1 F0F1 ATP synthase subunit epsilon [Rickettsia prowazekii str. Chernikova]AFE50439.1 F0F1 ATP synthase s
MHETIRVKIITPSSIAFEKQSKMVTMPGEDGMFGVLPHHVPMIVNLKAGLVQIYIYNIHNYENTYLISGGVTEITSHYINIVTEVAINVTNLSESEISTQRYELQKLLSHQH